MFSLRPQQWAGEVSDFQALHLERGWSSYRTLPTRLGLQNSGLSGLYSGSQTKLHILGTRSAELRALPSSRELPQFLPHKRARGGAKGVP